MLCRIVTATEVGLVIQHWLKCINLDLVLLSWGVEFFLELH